MNVINLVSLSLLHQAGSKHLLLLEFSGCPPNTLSLLVIMLGVLAAGAGDGRLAFSGLLDGTGSLSFFVE